METMLKALRMVQQVVGKSAPYVLIEIVLPGGTMLALLLFLYQNRKSKMVTRRIDRIRRAFDRVASAAGREVDDTVYAATSAWQLIGAPARVTI